MNKIDASIRSYKVKIPNEQIKDLNNRIDLNRWPDDELVSDNSQGVKLAELKKLVNYWRNEYDWGRCEAALNNYPQFITNIDNVDIHFLHIKSRHENALPLLLTHGWPGSVIEFMKVIEPLTNPEAYGGKASDAFHLIIPSLPGFGFSGKPRELGWKVERIAKAWEVLMARLGYDKYVAQGGDVGAAVSSRLGERASASLIAIHTNQPFVLPPPPYENLSNEEQRMMDDLALMGAQGAGYAMIQGTRPQTLGYGLADSPIGQAAWIYEKLIAWTDCDGNVENILTRDEILDNIMLYWLTNSATSAARFYWENHGEAVAGIQINVPVGVSLFPKEIYKAAKSWSELYMKNIIYWNETEKGGHFAAFEQPEIFTRELRNCFRLVR